MVLVSTETFLAKLAELYAPSGEGAAAKGTVTVSCKSVPASKVGSKQDRARAKLAPEEDQPVLLFRACKYGNNKHKKKYSTVVAAGEHGAFHAALSALLKTKVDVSAADARPAGPSRVAKVKKATE